MWKNDKKWAKVGTNPRDLQPCQCQKVLSAEERRELIYAPFPVVKVPPLHSDHAHGARRWNLSQMDQEREAW